jgi:choline-sulfatase
VLFVSFVAPHFPLTAPARWFYRYFDQDLPLPKLYPPEERPHHPFTDDYARTVDYDTHFKSPRDVKRALAGYSGLVSSMDENVGDVLRALRAAGLEDSTRVIYTSDHGDNAGARGLWGKSTFYEESAGVPLIVAGPDVAAGRVVGTPVSQIDCAPTILDAVGAAKRVGGAPLPGASLFEIAEGANPRGPVISEYHAIGAVAGAFMLRFGKWKYCHYVAYRPQLFDLDADPEERVDLAQDARFADVVAEGERRLRAKLDPKEVDARRSGARPNCWRASGVGKRRWRAATWDLRRPPAPHRR